MRKSIENIVGNKYGRLTVISKAPMRNHCAMWNCLCDCGNTCVVYDYNLRRGRSKSCGCYLHERAKETNLTHGESKTRLFHIWQSMKARCNNPRNKSFAIYGGRGITVCDEWQESYEAFRDWACGNGYKDNLTIDRIENDKGYSPDNCKWSSVVEQQNNRRNNRVIEYGGESMTMAEWARRKNISIKTLHQRLAKGWSVERALTEQLHTNKSLKAKK